jgi:ADP-dependent NAD(P)H-hydrate dehydratase
MSTQLELVTRLPELAPRPPDSHKGDFGRVLVIAGSRGMSGAAVLCGSAALRGGAGLVRVAVPQEVSAIVAVGNPCYMTVPLPNDQGHVSEQAFGELQHLALQHDVLALGPGLGRSIGLNSLVTTLLTELATPIVLDADGLNALESARALSWSRKAAVVLTPHPGEFARLIGSDIPTVQGHRQELAVDFAREYSVVLVLKGHQTIVTDGQRMYLNTTGNPGMATAGSGDVLTGTIAALVGQGLSPFEAAQLGVYLHGLAGDLARDDLGEMGLTADDILNQVPRAQKRWRAEASSGGSNVS